MVRSFCGWDEEMGKGHDSFHWVAREEARCSTPAATLPFARSVEDFSAVFSLGTFSFPGRPYLAFGSQPHAFLVTVQRTLFLYTHPYANLDKN